MGGVRMLIHEENGTFGASFPDFPGAITAADSLDALIPKAKKMLAFHVEGMIEDGEDVPTPRTAEKLRSDLEYQADAEGATPWWLDVDLPVPTAP